MIKAYNQMDEAFPGGPEPANVVIEADVRAPEVQQGIAALRQAVDGPAEFGSPVTTTVARTAGRGGERALAGSGTDDTSNDALVKLREEVIPETIGKVPGTETNVNGMTAGSKDFNDLMKSRAPLVSSPSSLTAFILLMVAFRSIVIGDLDPAQSALGRRRLRIARLGLPGRASRGLLGFESMGRITARLPMFLFVVLFRTRWTTTCSSSADPAHDQKG